MTRSLVAHAFTVALPALMAFPALASAHAPGPHEVVLHDRDHFRGRSERLRLAPQQRMLLIGDVEHQLGLDVESIEIGPGLAVMIFPETEFTLPVDGDPLISERSLSRIDGAAGVSVASMIIFRRELGRPPGVYLVASAFGARFYAAPATAAEQIVQHPNFVGTIPAIDRVVLETGHLGAGAVEVALYDGPNFSGRRVILPAYGIHRGEYALHDLGLSEVASMQIRLAVAPTFDTPICGDWPHWRYRDDRIALAGVWQSNLGLVYLIEHDRDDDDFKWEVPQIDEKGKGEIEAGRLSARWKGDRSRGKATGRVTEIDHAGRATRIEWEHGLVLYR